MHRRVEGVRPDLVFGNAKLAVFVNGCFWHRCPDCRRPLPVSRAEYWAKKIAGNVARDVRVSEELRRDGWLVLRLWEHELRGSTRGAVERLLSILP